MSFRGGYGGFERRPEIHTTRETLLLPRYWEPLTAAGIRFSRNGVKGQGVGVVDEQHWRGGGGRRGVAEVDWAAALV